MIYPALRRADQIVVLYESRVRAEGTLQDVRDTCPEMKDIWRCWAPKGYERKRFQARTPPENIVATCDAAVGYHPF
jgi:hypothetical protein